MEKNLAKADQYIAALASRGWVSLRQFAKIIDISYPTAMRMKDSGKVSTIRVGGIHRVYSTEVKRFLEEGNATEGAGDNDPQQPLY